MAAQESFRAHMNDPHRSQRGDLPARRLLAGVTSRVKSLSAGCVSCVLILSAAAMASADDIPRDSVITLQRHTCENHCPVYKVVIFGDGTVIYYGEYYVHRKGLVLDRIGTEAFRQLIESVGLIDYFNLKSEYGYHDTSGCESRIPDGPVVSTSVSIGGQSHAVLHHHRCGGLVPGKLTDFENGIDKLANTARFTN